MDIISFIRENEESVKPANIFDNIDRNLPASRKNVGHIALVYHIAYTIFFFTLPIT